MIDTEVFWMEKMLFPHLVPGLWQFSSVMLSIPRAQVALQVRLPEELRSSRIHIETKNLRSWHMTGAISKKMLAEWRDEWLDKWRGHLWSHKRRLGQVLHFSKSSANYTKYRLSSGTPPLGSLHQSYTTEQMKTPDAHLYFNQLKIIRCGEKRSL